MVLSSAFLVIEAGPARCRAGRREVKDVALPPWAENSPQIRGRHAFSFRTFHTYTFTRLVRFDLRAEAAGITSGRVGQRVLLFVMATRSI